MGTQDYLNQWHLDNVTDPKYAQDFITLCNTKKNLIRVTGFVGFVIYQTRCRIVHNKATEFHLTLSINNFDYYKAAKYMEKAEYCIDTARYYFKQATDIIEYDCIIPWEYGYQLIFDIRTTNFTTAIIWYNNCFD